MFGNFKDSCLGRMNPVRFQPLMISNHNLPIILLTLINNINKPSEQWIVDHFSSMIEIQQQDGLPWSNYSFRIINNPYYSGDLLIGLSTTYLHLNARDDVYFQRQKIRIEINCCEELVQCWVSCGWEVQGEAHQETVLLVSRAGRKQRNQRCIHQHSWSLAREEAAEFNGIFPSIFTRKHQFMSIKKEEWGINLPFEGLSELMTGSENLYQLLYVSSSCKLMPSNEPLYQDEW